MSLELAERSTEYLASDYCFSCAYFQRAKGHFGYCKDAGAKSLYDGTKKGSACTGWRLESRWLDVKFELPEPPAPIRRRLNRQVHAWWKKEALGGVIGKDGRDYKVIARGSILQDRLKAKQRAARRIVNIEKALFRLPILPCPQCHSDKIIRNGKRHIKRGIDSSQRMWCKNCSYRFTIRIDTRLKFRYRNSEIDYALNLIRQGLSTRQVKAKLRDDLHLSVSNVSIFRWIQQFAPDLDLSIRKKIGYRHLTPEQKAKQRENTLRHNSLNLASCRCTYHRCKALGHCHVNRPNIGRLRLRQEEAWKIWGRVLIRD